MTADPFANLLSLEEVSAIEATLLPARDRFSLRLAAYSLRLLQALAADQQQPIAAIDASQLQTWLLQSPQLAETLSQQGLVVDQSFLDFWTRLLLSAKQPLVQAAESAAVSLEQLQLATVIDWYRQQFQPDAGLPTA